MLLGTHSCYQDMHKDPSFDYPQEPPKPPVDEEGQIFYMPFEDSYAETQSAVVADITGTPGFDDGKEGKAYAGAAGSYLTFKLSDLTTAPGSDVSVGFWYKLNAIADRAGIVVVGPPTEGMGPDDQNDRSSGFRIFREDVDGKQRIKGNVGNGTVDVWLDGQEKADLDPAAVGWKYITLTMTKGTATLYIDGDVVATNDFSEISWARCDIISIGSGAPRFTGWGHLSDDSLIDELRIYNKTLTASQIMDIINTSAE